MVYTLLGAPVHFIFFLELLEMPACNFPLTHTLPNINVIWKYHHCIRAKEYNLHKEAEMTTLLVFTQCYEEGKFPLCSEYNIFLLSLLCFTADNGNEVLAGLNPSSA